MMIGRPAGLSDDDDDDDDFEFSTDFDDDYNYKNQKYQNKTPIVSDEEKFYTAIKNKNIATMKTMLENGFSIDQPLSGGWSPLMHASSLGLLDVMEFLLKAGANVNFNKELFTSLMALCKSRSSDEDEPLKCLNVLLEHGANIDATNRYACTALMFACSSGHTSLVRKLTESDCDVNIQDSEGWSALFHAVNKGNEDIVEILIKSKARVDLIDKRRRTALELARQKGYDHLEKLVCSKKERRKLFDVEKDLVLPERKAKDPVEELFLQLPDEKASSSSGFSADVGKMLWAMRLGYFSKQFIASNIQLNEFLLITDERLKELGVRFSVHRQRILTCVRNFHLHQWNKASLGLKPRNEKMNLEDGVKLLCNTIKHLHILNATLNYIRVQQSVPVKPEVFTLCEKAAHQLTLISSELNFTRSFAAELSNKERIVPADLITSKKPVRSSLTPILVITVFLGFVLWKKKQSIPWLEFTQYFHVN